MCCDRITANNTVAIVVSSQIAKDICGIFKIRPKKMASLIDTFSCIVQGILPYGAQMLVAVSLTNELSFACGAFDIIPFCFYQYILLVVLIFYIIFGAKLKSKVKEKIKDK